MGRERQTGRSAGKSERGSGYDDDAPMQRFSKDYRPKPKRSSRSRFSRDSGSRDSGSRKGRDGRSGRDGRGRDRKAEMHQVICDKCQKSCEVPFKPSSDKPVYCSECFEQQGNSRSGSRSGGSSAELKVINEKLDKIMKALKI